MTITTWYPEDHVEHVYPDSVPDEIASVATEAYTCLGASAFRGAISMARATVEATAKHKGITVNGIYSKIEEMYKQGLIYEHVKDAAHEVRFAGNDAAHGDLVDNPADKEEAEAVLEMMDMVLDGVFIAPGKTAEQAARRAAKKAALTAASPSAQLPPGTPGP